jgi:hypothetical protein
LQWNLSAAYLRQRFVLIQGLSENWWGTGEWNPFSNLPQSPSYGQLLSRWEIPLFGEPRPELSQALIQSQGLTSADRIGDIKVARRMVGYLACAPSFQSEAIEPDFLVGG